MHVQGQWAESADTVEGSAQHERSRRGERATPGETRGEEPWPAHPRDLHLTDEEHGLTGRLDAIEEEHGHWAPVERKHSAPPEPEREIRASGGALLRPGAWNNDQIQLAAQGLLLRANGYRSDYGYLYYRKTKERVRMEFDETLLAAVRDEIARTRETEKGSLPPPLVDSPKCPGCSLHGVCLPDETNWLLRRAAHPPVRVMPENDDAGVLYISEAGAYVRKRSESLVVHPRKDGSPVEIPLKDVRHVALAGPVQVSTQAIQECLTHGIGVSWLTAGGRYLGGTFPPFERNFTLRQRQFRALDDQALRLQMARVLVFAKVANGRTLLRRQMERGAPVLSELRRVLGAVRRAKSIEEVMGLEGLAARAYFPALAGLLKKGEGMFDWRGRSRRPPKDPVNALLSLGYALLTRDMETALRAVGLEPMAGFFHAVENGRASLALDLMEPFRPLIVDSVVLRLINTRTIGEDDFWILPGQASLKTNARKRFFTAYEARMREVVRHPRLRFSVGYRRILELEARLFGRFLEGELSDYIPLMTR